jgi:hypothetical protein
MHLPFRYRTASPEERAKRLPALRDLSHDFGFEVCRIGSSVYRNLSYGYQGAQEAWTLLDASADASRDLKAQSYVEASDLSLLRTATWAAYDICRELNELDREIDEAAGGKLTNLLEHGLDGRERGDGHRKDRQRLLANIAAWVQQVNDPAAKAWYEEKLATRAALLKETLAACDAVQTIAVRAAWMASHPVVSLPAELGEPLRQLRHEQIAQAETLTRALAAAVGEVAGVVVPVPDQQVAAARQLLSTQ